MDLDGLREMGRVVLPHTDCMCVHVGTAINNLHAFIYLVRLTLQFAQHLTSFRHQFFHFGGNSISLTRAVRQRQT